jgi:hypothetical protein
VLEYLGARSYAIYLVHSVVSRVDIGLREQLPELVKLAPDDDSPYKHLALLFGATLVASEVLYRAVERPFMRLGGRIIATEGRFRLSRWGRIALVTGLVAFGAVYFRHRLLTTFGPKNIALHAPVIASSHEEGRPQSDALTNGVLEPEVGLHTRREDFPSAIIDLGEPRAIGAIRVYNRDDGYQEEALPLELSVSDDGQDFRVIARREAMFTQEYPWRIRVEGRPVRYVRFNVARQSVLCLSEVEIYEQRWMAAVP